MYAQVDVYEAEFLDDAIRLAEQDGRWPLVGSSTMDPDQHWFNFVSLDDRVELMVWYVP